MVNNSTLYLHWEHPHIATCNGGLLGYKVILCLMKGWSLQCMYAVKQYDVVRLTTQQVLVKQQLQKLVQEI